MEHSTYLFPEINFEKSIKKERLVYLLTFEMVLNYVFFYFRACFVIGVITLFIILFIQMMINGVKDNLMLIVVIACFISSDILIILNIVFLNKLVCTSGSDLETNKNNMRKLLNGIYDDINSNKIDENSIKYIRSPDFGLVRRITTLYCENKVYINITSLERGSNLSFLHGYLNYLKCKRIVAIFL